MTTDVQPAGRGTLDHATGPGLADVLDTVLDKGVVIDAYVQASLVGIDILTINARVVVASIDTYLRFAEAVNRLDLTENKGEGVRDLVNDVQQIGGKDSAQGIASSALGAVGETLQGVLPGDSSEERKSVSRGTKGQGD